jgi:hypothetical protein
MVSTYYLAKDRKMSKSNIGYLSVVWAGMVLLILPLSDVIPGSSQAFAQTPDQIPICLDYWVNPRTGKLECLNFTRSVTPPAHKAVRVNQGNYKSTSTRHLAKTIFRRHVSYVRHVSNARYRKSTVINHAVKSTNQEITQMIFRSNP